MASGKPKSRKVLHKGGLISNTHPKWRVYAGHLKRGAGRPRSTEHLFRVVAEKLPYESLEDVRRNVVSRGLSANGVYVAHDSMGYARYIGRGDIFQRLRARRADKESELKYFSFYVVNSKNHEREIESMLIRTAGPMLDFNTRKRRQDIEAGDVRDFEAGTEFYERQAKRGRRKRTPRGRKPVRITN